MNKYCCSENDKCVDLKPKYGNIVKLSKCAFVTLLMINDSYLPGIILSGCQLKTIAPEIDRICMVTPDISNKAIKIIKHLYIVKKVEYIEIDTSLSDLSNNQIKYIYAKTFTKLNCFKLIKYDKIVLFDADMIPLRGLKELFLYPTPSFPFLGHIRLWGKELEKRLEYYNKFVCNKFFNGERITKTKLIDYEKIIKDIIKITKNNNNLKTLYTKQIYETTISVLKPSINTYDKCINKLNFHVKYKHIQHLKGDTTFLTEFYKYKIHFLDIRYLGRWVNFNNIKEICFIDEYSKIKPWDLNNLNTNQIKNNKLWWYCYIFVLNNNKHFLKYKELSKLYYDILNILLEQNNTKKALFKKIAHKLNNLKP